MPLTRSLALPTAGERAARGRGRRRTWRGGRCETGLQGWRRRGGDSRLGKKRGGGTGKEDGEEEHRLDGNMEELNKVGEKKKPDRECEFSTEGG